MSAHDRRLRLPARAGGRSRARPTAAVRAARDRLVPVCGLGDRAVGKRPWAHAAAAACRCAAARARGERRRSARGPALHARRAAADLRLHATSRRRQRRVRLACLSDVGLCPVDPIAGARFGPAVRPRAGSGGSSRDRNARGSDALRPFRASCTAQERRLTDHVHAGSRTSPPPPRSGRRMATRVAGAGRACLAACALVLAIALAAEQRARRRRAELVLAAGIAQRTPARDLLPERIAVRGRRQRRARARRRGPLAATPAWSLVFSNGGTNSRGFHAPPRRCAWRSTPRDRRS